MKNIELAIQIIKARKMGYTNHEIGLMTNNTTKTVTSWFNSLSKKDIEIPPPCHIRKFPRGYEYPSIDDIIPPTFN